MKDRFGNEIDESKKVIILLGNMQRISARIFGDVAIPFPFVYKGGNGDEFIGKNNDKLASFIVDRGDFRRKIIAQP